MDNAKNELRRVLKANTVSVKELVAAEIVYGLLFATVWLTEGRWLTRGDYDGSEWWDFHSYPPIPTDLTQN